MAFDLHLRILESTPAGRVVQRVAATEHISPELAVTRILTDVAKLHDKKTPVQEMGGALSGGDA